MLSRVSTSHRRKAKSISLVVAMRWVAGFVWLLFFVWLVHELTTPPKAFSRRLDVGSSEVAGWELLARDLKEHPFLVLFAPRDELSLSQAVSRPVSSERREGHWFPREANRFNFGFEKGVLWIATRLKNDSDLPRTFVASTGLSADVEFFVLNNGVTVGHRLSSHYEPISSREIKTAATRYEAILPPREERLLIVRALALPASIPFEVRAVEGEDVAAGQRNALFSFAFGVLLFASLYQFAVFIFIRIWANLTAATTLFALFLSLSSLSGHLAEWVFPNHPALAEHIVAIAPMYSVYLITNFLMAALRIGWWRAPSGASSGSQQSLDVVEIGGERLLAKPTAQRSESAANYLVVILAALSVVSLVIPFESSILMSSLVIPPVGLFLARLALIHRHRSAIARLFLPAIIILALAATYYVFQFLGFGEYSSNSLLPLILSAPVMAFFMNLQMATYVSAASKEAIIRNSLLHELEQKVAMESARAKIMEHRVIAGSRAARLQALAHAAFRLSHRVNNPLHAALLAAEELGDEIAEGAVPEEKRRAVMRHLQETIQKSIQRAARNIGELDRFKRYAESSYMENVAMADEENQAVQADDADKKLT